MSKRRNDIKTKKWCPNKEIYHLNEEMSCKQRNGFLTKKLEMMNKGD